MGSPGSPYTRKMLGMMRFRRIPYELTLQSRHAAPARKKSEPRPVPKVPLLPTYYLPNEDGEVVAVTDSSPLIRRFETEYTGRSVLPADPTMAFIDMLLEDFGDEWLTKAMFHYRWSYKADIHKAGEILPRWGNVSAAESEIAPLSKMIAERQIARLSYVGSNEITGPVIEASFKRFLHLFNAHLGKYPFLMGERPGSSDFAFFGQLTALSLFDPTPQALILQETPRVYAWVEIMEDLSGLPVDDQDWIDPDNVPDTLLGLLKEVGRVYAPYLVANAKAIMAGDTELNTTIDGKPWTQNPFPYQAKCLMWLRDAYEGLGDSDRAKIDAILSGTGCEQLFE
ncbi:MAG: glutathione S-transferase family protein [Alphaproteobacteria bacterium]|nr:MAG: glutathione S-transferase family protein [Alphaproteobacteria bacterium]